MKAKKLILILVGSLVLVGAASFWGIPAFAQTYIATKIPGEPLSQIAANQIINNSGLPKETLPYGATNEITRGRDAVNAYRYAHTQLYNNGWYRGISNNHTPLLLAMVNALENQGFTSNAKLQQDKTAEVLQKFWYASDTENAKELGYDSLEILQSTVANLVSSGKIAEARNIKAQLKSKWH